MNKYHRLRVPPNEILGVITWLPQTLTWGICFLFDIACSISQGSKFVLSTSSYIDILFVNNKTLKEDVYIKCWSTCDKLIQRVTFKLFLLINNMLNCWAIFQSLSFTRSQYIFIVFLMFDKYKMPIKGNSINITNQIVK